MTTARSWSVFQTGARLRVVDAAAAHHIAERGAEAKKTRANLGAFWGGFECSRSRWSCQFHIPEDMYKARQITSRDGRGEGFTPRARFHGRRAVGWLHTPTLGERGYVNIFRGS
jgi:hypothetical protein